MRKLKIQIMDRRHFLGGMLAAGGLLFTGHGGLMMASAHESGDDHDQDRSQKQEKRRRDRRNGNRSRKGCADEDTVIFISDFHSNPGGYQSDKLRATVADILTMDPLPRSVIAFGDIAYLTGQVAEYRNARDILAPLEEAGISLTFGMGNHDRREEFAEVFPEYASDSLLEGRLVHIVKGKYADIIMLDSLQQGDDRSTWITEGALDERQKEWLQTVLDSCSKPVFVAAHHPLSEIGIRKMLLACPSCAGFIHGHYHKWLTDWDHLNWSSKRLLPILCLPSTGHYGDIGYVVFHMREHEAEAELVQSDFYFPKVTAQEEYPALWHRMMEKNRDARFWFTY